MFEYVFFDLDGTLLNTLYDLADAANYALVKQGLPIHPVEDYKYYVGNGIPKLIERIVPENSTEETLKNTRKLFSEYYSVHSMDNTRPYDGIRTLIKKLKELSVTTVVITNKDDAFAKKLISVYFGDDISAVYGGVDGYPKKPDPYWVNEAVKNYKIEKSSVLYVGDSSVDMLTAKNAGLVSCGVTWGFRTRQELIENGADHICDTTEQILKLVTE